MSPQLKSFEGPDVQLVLDRIRRELGPDTKIDGAEKLRVGGLLGFFAKEQYRVVVEVPDRQPALSSDNAAHPIDGRLSRRQRRRAESSAASPATATAPAGIDNAPLVATTPAPAPPELGADVFSAMAEATDDVNDVTSLSSGAVPEAIGPGASPAPARVEAFDAVLSRVAHTLGDPPADAAGTADRAGTADSGHGHVDLGHDGRGTNNGHVSAAHRDGGDSWTGDEAGIPADIASRAAMFLAESTVVPDTTRPAESTVMPDDAVMPDESTVMPHDTVPVASGVGAEMTPGFDDDRVEALRLAGLDDDAVAAVSEGLRAGGALEALLLATFGRLAPAPALPRLPGSLLVVVGQGAQARHLALSLASEMGGDPAAVAYCSLHPEVAGPAGAPVPVVCSMEEAAELAPGWRRAGAAVVVVDCAVTASERSWADGLIGALRPTAVWGVVDATAKAEDVSAWAEALGGLDALAVENLDATVSPAAALTTGIPVARLDGHRANAARWTATVVDRVAPCG